MGCLQEYWVANSQGKHIMKEEICSGEIRSIKTLVKKICWRYDCEIINAGDIELIEIECLNVVDFGKYSLVLCMRCRKTKREKYQRFYNLVNIRTRWATDTVGD